MNLFEVEILVLLVLYESQCNLKRVVVHQQILAYQVGSQQGEYASYPVTPSPASDFLINK